MLEVCVDTPQGAVVAMENGAGRIELSAALEVGGVTPSETMIRTVRHLVDRPLIVLIRCRSGDFQFDANECQWMMEEADRAIDLGADGIAIGGLVTGDQLDERFLSSLPSRYPKKEVVIHRAFDHIVDHREAIERLVEWGFTRILTSGGPSTALQGADRLSQLNQESSGRIEILPAGGIQPENAAKILRSTGCRQLHGSFRDPRWVLGEKTTLAQRLPCAKRICEVRKILDDCLFDEAQRKLTGLN